MRTRSTKLLDTVVTVMLAVIFVVGAIKTGELAYHLLRTFAEWVFP